MKVNEIRQFLSFQHKALDYLDFLIKYDREQALKNNEAAEKTIVLKAFIDTQRKSLQVASLLLQKHETALKQEEEAKAKSENLANAQTQKDKCKTTTASTTTKSVKAEIHKESGLFDALEEGENE